MEIPQHYPHVALDEFVVMPDHIHGILVLRDIVAIANTGGNNGDVTLSVRHNNHVEFPDVGVRHGEPLLPGNINTSPKSPYPKRNEYQKIIPNSLGIIINQYKSAITRWCRKNEFPQFKWQRNFFEHIIRNDTSFYRIGQYIRNNPANWFVHAKNHTEKELSDMCKDE
jgi:REP element-mobilizing transposase RayT